MLAILTAVLGCSSDSPTLEIKGARVEHVVRTRVFEAPFERIVSVDQLRDGAWVVGDQGTESVVLLDSLGNVLARVGRKGRGPGEFHTMRGAYRCLGDTIAVADFGSGHLSLITVDGFVRHVQTPPSLEVGEFLGCSADRAVFVRYPAQLPGFETQWFSVTLFAYGLASDQLSWLGVFRGTEMYVSRTASAFFEKPFGVRTLTAIGDSGVLVGQTDEAFIRRIDLSGSEKSFYTPPLPRRAVGPADRRRLEAERLAEEGSASARRDLAVVLREADWGSQQPRYDRLLAERSGAVWLRVPPAARDSSALWVRIRSDAMDPMLVRIPLTTRVLFVDSSRVVGVEEGSTAERIVVHEISHEERRP